MIGKKALLASLLAFLMTISMYILPKVNTTREQGIALVKRVYDKFFAI